MAQSGVRQGAWGMATINGVSYTLAGPVIPQPLPDVVPAFRTGPVSLEHRIGARWWDMSDWSLGIGGEYLDIYQEKHHLAWAENIDASRGGDMLMGYRLTDESSIVASYLTPPPVATPVAFASEVGWNLFTTGRKLYAIVGNIVYKRTAAGVWSALTGGAMTTTVKGRTILTPRGPDKGNVTLFVGWNGTEWAGQGGPWNVGPMTAAGDAQVYKTTNGSTISGLVMVMSPPSGPSSLPVRAISGTVIPMYNKNSPWDMTLLGDSRGSVEAGVVLATGYYMHNVGSVSTTFPGPVLFLAPRFDHHLTSGIWALINGELWNWISPQVGEEWPVRVRWGKNLAGGCMHGKLACVFSGLRMWLLDETGKRQDISPVVEELAGFGSGSSLAFTNAVSDGNHIYATVKYLNQEWLWSYDETDESWQSISEATLGSPSAEATLGLVADGYDSADRGLWWVYSGDYATDAVYCRRYELPQGLRQSGRDRTGNSAVGHVLLPWFTGRSPEPGTLYKHWLEHTVPSGCQIVVTKRTNYGAYDNADLNPNTIAGTVTAERKATFITCGGSDGLPFSSVQFQYALQANSSGAMPRIHRVGFEWYKATRVTQYNVDIALHQLTRQLRESLFERVLALMPNNLYSLMVPYICDTYVRLVSAEPTENPNVIRLMFQTV